MNPNSVRFLQHQAASLLLYQEVLTGEAGQAFLQLLDTLYRHDKPSACVYAYARWFRALVAQGQSWQDYLIQRLLYDDNPFTHQAQLHPFCDLNPTLVQAAQDDLSALQHLATCGGPTLSQWVRQVTKSDSSLVAIPDHIGEHPLEFGQTWNESLPELAAFHRQRGAGTLAQYHVLRWHESMLEGVAVADPVRLDELAGYESQKAILVQNTQRLLAGEFALHVLLYGSRGTGKSSLVKALVNEYGDRGLRLLEVMKSQLYDLPKISERLRNLPQKFILFVDDLSFEEDDEAFKALKVVLEGSVTARPQNVVVYATSNRRHLIREFFEDRPRPSAADEIHNWDTVEEKLSFSDRFGLTLTFESADQRRYLEIVRHLAGQRRLDLPLEELDAQALQWATRHNGRSGRTARQFIEQLQPQLKTARASDDPWNA
ncbi:ATP-binding protein [Sodalinema gerasimenkoae]|uniref:ATP-binding protein n=1 Tax=Sodalinema gerasimenkoae TaxID=2862348 RepID=UPI00135BFA91|nr:ATP-binding protein [Sodalinema gerasimenkoae]